MKALLNFIKDELINGIRVMDVLIIPDEQMPPLKAGFPAIGLMDGGFLIEHDKTDKPRINIVKIFIYQEIQINDESSIMGSDRFTGILDLCDQITGTDDINGVLDLTQTQLIAQGYYNSHLISGDESKPLGKGDDKLVMKQLTYRFYKQ